MWPFKKSAVDDVALSAIAKHIGAKPTKVYAGDDVSVGFWSADAAGRPAGTLVTLGMSAKPMTLDHRAVDTDTKRSEIVCYSDPSETNLDTLVHWMQAAAKIPFETAPASFLGWGHTKQVGAIAPGSALTTAIAFNPLVRPDKGTIFERDGDPVALLWLTFLTDAEYELSKTNGPNAILDLFGENAHPIEFGTKRKSYV